MDKLNERERCKIEPPTSTLKCRSLRIFCTVRPSSQTEYIRYSLKGHPNLLNLPFAQKTYFCSAVFVGFMAQKSTTSIAHKIRSELSVCILCSSILRIILARSIRSSAYLNSNFWMTHDWPYRNQPHTIHKIHVKYTLNENVRFQFRISCI